MRFQLVKCNMMKLTRKHLNKIQASYTLEGAVLENVDNIKYLMCVCGTVSSIMSGLETRSLGLNTLGTT